MLLFLLCFFFANILQFFRHLAKEVRCFTLFATHFNEITQLADKLPAVCNLHVTAATTEKTITPLYQIREGPCDKSYGIHCARMADFPNTVTEVSGLLITLI